MIELVRGRADGQLLQTPTGPLAVPAQFDPALGPGVRLSLVVPTYNESKNLAELVERLDALLDGPLQGSYEIIVVDDDSPDRTWELAAGLCARFPRLRVMRRQGERGLSTAVIRGWQAARGEVLGVMDADLQHPPELNLGLLEQIDKGADLATGSRHVEGGGVSDWSVIRRALSRGAQLLGLLLLPSVLGRLTDPMSGYFMVRRPAIAGVPLDPIGYKILIEVVGRGTIRWIGEVGYVFRERTQGESKVTWRLYHQYLAHLWRLRWSTLPKSRFLQFAVVGASGVLVDMGLLYLLSDPATLHLGLTRSKLIAAEAAIFNNFIWNDAWTFRDATADQRQLGQKVKRFLKFNLICTAGLSFNVAILNLLFNLAGMDRYLANGIAIGAVTLWNFWLALRFNWRVTELGASGPPGRSR